MVLVTQLSGEQHITTDLWHAENNIYRPEAFERDFSLLLEINKIGFFSQAYETIFPILSGALVKSATCTTPPRWLEELRRDSTSLPMNQPFVNAVSLQTGIRSFTFHSHFASPLVRSFAYMSTRSFAHTPIRPIDTASFTLACSMPIWIPESKRTISITNLYREEVCSPPD